MDKDRRELEQNHLQNTRDMQERLAELEKSTKVRHFLFYIHLFISLFIFRN